MSKIIYTVLTLLVLIPLILLVSVLITGRVKRAYAVLDSAQEIQISNQTAPVANFAEAYRPIMYKQAQVSTPPILWVWYNAVDQGDKVDFIYYNVWENEINPNPLIHKYYSFFRAFYYGYPLYDIEYVQVTVSKRDGRVETVMFETGPSDNYHSIFNEHIVLRAKFIDGVNYDVRLTNRDTLEELKTYTTPLEFNNTNIKLAVQTWNHLSALLTPEKKANYTEEVNYNKLVELSNQDYANYKFVRKSQADHVTRENKLPIFVSAIAIFVFVSLPAMLLARMKKK